MTGSGPTAPSPAPPPTERLYWTRPRDRQFSARVTAVEGQTVALERSLFYPAGGGQPCDQGRLSWTGGEGRVTDVQKDDRSGVIWHTLEGPLPEVGEAVTGTLDWTRRYRHSQRHTAEHLLAQAFARVSPTFGVRSVSMRGPECTLDLAGQPGEAHVLAAQRLLTEALREPLNLDTVTVNADDLGAFPLRRPPQVSGPVRVVLFRTADGEIWEASACGGTHLSSGHSAAPVVVLRTERVKGDLTRVTFMAGEEATERLSAVYAQAQALARGFSVGVERLPERVADLQTELKASHDRTTELRRTLAAELLRGADWHPAPFGRAALLETGQDELLPVLLREAAAAGGSVLVALGPDGACGVSSTVPDEAAGTLLKALLSRSGGRGGGRHDLAQGQAGTHETFRQAAVEWLDTLG